MRYFSHRGYHVDLPENTHEAFAAAIERGVEGIETDLRLSSDGEIVLYHNRATPDGTPIHRQTHAEICRAAGYETPLLADALERWDEPVWMLEVKAPSVLPKLLPLLEQYKNIRRLQVTSFWHQVVADVRRRVEIESGLLVAHAPLSVGSLPEGWLPDPREIGMIVWYYETADPAVLEATAARGFRNWVYGADAAEEHQRCETSLALEGVITDHPPLRRAWL